ncbi:MAG: hypothetical protein HGA71_11725 [Azonexaceae bacterium]|nr:hypothetical protein [Azonexaceae bacterium]
MRIIQYIGRAFNSVRGFDFLSDAHHGDNIESIESIDGPDRSQVDSEYYKQLQDCRFNPESGFMMTDELSSLDVAGNLFGQSDTCFDIW